QQVGQYADPEAPCDVSTSSHYLVNSADLYMRHASGGGRYADQVPKLMGDAYRALTDALHQGQEANAAVWFLLGRWYEMKKDLVGMDTAYNKAQTLAPKCAKDITKHRKIMWS